MAYIDVEIDLDDFDDDDIFEEAILRLRRMRRSSPSEAQKEEIREVIAEFNNVFNMEPAPEMKIETFSDKMKVDLLIPVYEKYSYQQIEEMVSNYK